MSKNSPSSKPARPLWPALLLAGLALLPASGQAGHSKAANASAPASINSTCDTRLATCSPSQPIQLAQQLATPPTMVRNASKPQPQPPASSARSQKLSRPTDLVGPGAPANGTSPATPDGGRTSQPGLMSRASDAIYRALKGAFTFEQPEAANQHSSAPKNATQANHKPAASTARPQPAAEWLPAESEPGGLELTRLLDGLLRSLYALRDSLSRNRTARLAPDEAADEQAPAKLVVEPAKTTSEELHLLCRLLHRQLDAQVGSTPTTIAANTSSPATTVAPERPPERNSSQPGRPIVLVGDPRELNESQADYLLESVFGRPARASPVQVGPQEPVERAARRLLEGLLNRAASLADSDYAAPGEASAPPPDAGGAQEPAPRAGVTLTVKQWPRATYLDERRHLHLVFWLLEQPAANSTRRLLVEPSRALELLAQLDRPLIEAELEAHRLSQVGARLIDRFALSNGRNNGSGSSESPRVIDDDQSSASRQTSIGPVQLLLNRLAESTFAENLHLYLILLFLVLLCVILCFACPMMCCRQSPAFPVPPRQRKSPKSPPSSTGHQSAPTESERADAAAAADDDASIWRKLSNTSTTLTRDQSQIDSFSRRPEGWRALDKERRLERRLERSADDRTSTLVYTLSSSDLLHGSAKDEQAAQRRRPRTGKSPRAAPNEFEEEPAGWPVDDRLEQRRSDTMSKSELVMVKEKLVPIAREHDQRHRPAATQTSDAPDYVNQPARQMASLERDPSRYIDSTTDSSGQPASGFLRRNLQLPERAQAQLEAIKGELSRVEARDAASSKAGLSSTYRRYDVT